MLLDSVYPGITSTKTLGIRVDLIDSIESVCARLAKALDKSSSFSMTFANPATAIIARRETDLTDILRDFDLVAPDGIGMVFALRLLHANRKAARISFDDTSLAPFLFELAARRQITVALIGGKVGVTASARNKILEEHSSLQIVGTFSGFGCLDVTIKALVELAPGIVIVGMGTLLQEQFLLSLRDKGWIGLGFTCGGYFDQLAKKGTTYYPRWVDGLELRWAYRLLMEPRRLWRRYLLQYPEFGLRLFAELLWSVKGKNAGSDLASIGNSSDWENRTTGDAV